MNNAPAKITFSQKLSIPEMEIVVANSGTKIKLIEKKELTSHLIDSISEVYAYCKYASPQPIELKAMADELYKDTSNYFTTLTVKEINLAFHNGARKLYGDFAGISNAVMFGWMQKFVSSPDRLAALKKQRDFLNPPPKELTEEQKRKIIHDGCLKVFEEFKLKGKVFDMGNVNYNYLDSLGIFKWTKEIKFEFIGKAQQFLITEAKESLVTVKDKTQKEAIRKRLDELSNQKDDNVISMAKNIALNQYFGYLVEMEMELTEQINQTI